MLEIVSVYLLSNYTDLGSANHLSVKTCNNTVLTVNYIRVDNGSMVYETIQADNTVSNFKFDIGGTCIGSVYEPEEPLSVTYQYCSCSEERLLNIIACTTAVLLFILGALIQPETVFGCVKRCYQEQTGNCNLNHYVF